MVWWAVEVGEQCVLCIFVMYVFGLQHHPQPWAQHQRGQKNGCERHAARKRATCFQSCSWKLAGRVRRAESEVAVVPSIAGITEVVKQMLLFLHEEERLSLEAAIDRGVKNGWENTSVSDL